MNVSDRRDQNRIAHLSGRPIVGSETFPFMTTARAGNGFPTARPISKKRWIKA